MALRSVFAALACCFSIAAPDRDRRQFPDTLTLAREFDALIYIDSVKPAVFGIR